MAGSLGLGLGLALAYYDKILVAIATSLAAGAVAGVMTDVDLRAGVALGALVATVFVYDAMFRHPPRPTTSTRARVAAVVWHAFLGIMLAAAFL